MKEVTENLSANGTVQLDIVIPVLNEGQAFVSCLKSLREHVKIPFRVFVGYDFEEDITLKALQDSSIRGMEIIPVKNAGKGPASAVITAFTATSAPAVMVFTADDIYNADLIGRLYDEFEKGNDVVCCSRFAEGGVIRDVSFVKKSLPFLASKLLYHFARLPTHDATCGIRLFSRRVITQIPIESKTGFSFSIELTVKVHRLGWGISEIPARWFVREHNEKTFKALSWIPAYLPWFFFAFATSYLGRGPETVTLKERERSTS